MSRESDVLDSMRHIMDPDLGRDIVTLGFIKHLQITEAGQVSFTVELTTPACPVKEHFRSSCIESVSRLPWVTGRWTSPCRPPPAAIRWSTNHAAWKR